MHISETKTVKRSSDRSRRKNLPRKLETNDNVKQKNVSQLTDDSKDVNCESKENSSMVLSDNKLLQKDSYLRQLSFERCQERRDSIDIGSSPSKVHIINIDHSDIDRKNGNLTINLPSITKKFSDNEFLPLKKRLRVDGDNSDKLSDDKKETKNDFSLFSTMDSQTGLANTREDKRLTEEEMTEIVERMNKENSDNDDTDKKPNPSYYGSGEFSRNQNMYSDFNQQCLLIPKEERQDSLMQNYSSPSTMAQPPVLLLVIKVDSKNTLRDSGSNDNTKMDGGKNSKGSSPYDNDQETERKSNNLPKQVDEQSCTIPHISSDSKPNSKRNKATRRKRKESPCSKTNVSETDVTSSSENGAIESDLINNSDTQVCDFASDYNLKETEQLTVDPLSVNNSDCSADIPIENSDVCTVAENVTVYTTEVIPSEQVNEDKSCEEQKVEEVVFREPLPVPPKIENSVKLKGMSTGSSGKVRVPVKCGGKLKEIYISRRELSKLKPRSSVINKPSEPVVLNETTVANDSDKKALPEFKFVSQTVKPAVKENLTQKTGSKFLGATNLSHVKSGKNEEFENESVLSEAVGDDDGLKDNLLATVIDFQEQNNQEFIEIKNLMKQNNLLQRETNRLLRIMLEKK